jgi:hypothetical protein
MKNYSYPSEIMSLPVKWFIVGYQKKTVSNAKSAKLLQLFSTNVLVKESDALPNLTKMFFLQLADFLQLCLKRLKNFQPTLKNFFYK